MRLLDLFDTLLPLRRRCSSTRRRARHELADLGRRLSQILLECVTTGEVPFERVRNEIGLERLRAAATLEAGQLPPIDVHQLDQVRGSYSHLRSAIHAARRPRCDVV